MGIIFGMTKNHRNNAEANQISQKPSHLKKLD